MTRSARRCPVAKHLLYLRPNHALECANCEGFRAVPDGEDVCFASTPDDDGKCPHNGDREVPLYAWPDTDGHGVSPVAFCFRCHEEAHNKSLEVTRE